MARTETPAAEFGTAAPDFSLKGVDGQTWTLADCRGPKGTVVMFICNHCPFVKASIRRIARDCEALEEYGVKSVAIMPNDVSAYPADSFENMQAFAREHELPFPYLIDETQQVARAYGAVCTPDFFGYDADLALRYRGRLDEGRTEPPAPDAPRELLEAMRAVADTGAAPAEQLPSIGCSIKWKAG